MRNYLKAFGIGILLGTMPFIVSAKEGLVAEDAIAFGFSSHETTAIDSLSRVKAQDDKDKDSKKKSEIDKSKGSDQDPKIVDIKTNRPNIKEVPKARPKLRPTVVTDRIKVKRPPVRVNRPIKILRSVGI